MTLRTDWLVLKTEHALLMALGLVCCLHVKVSMDFVLYYSDTTEYNGRFEQSGFELASSGELIGNNISCFFSFRKHG